MKLYAYLDSRSCCSIGYPPETHLKLKSRKISFDHRLFLICPIVSKICIGHGSKAVVLSARFWNDGMLKWMLWTKEFSRHLSLIWVSEGGISYSVTAPGVRKHGVRHPHAYFFMECSLITCGLHDMIHGWGISGDYLGIYWDFNICGFCCQKQVSQAGKSNYIPQLTAGCNYLSLPEIPASGNKVLICSLF